VDAVLARIEALYQLVKPTVTGQDADTLQGETNDMRDFVRAKHAAVTAELARLP